MVHRLAGRRPVTPQPPKHAYLHVPIPRQSRGAAVPRPGSTASNFVTGGSGLRTRHAVPETVLPTARGHQGARQGVQRYRGDVPRISA